MSNQVVIIIVTAIMTAIANNLFTFLKERKISSYKYVEDTLKKIYIPILDIMNRGYFPGDGYNGLDSEQVQDIKKVLDDNRELAEPKIERIVERYVEEIMHDSRIHHQSGAVCDRVYDLDRKLLWEVLYGFNKIRKTLGLPYELKYLSKINYRVYRLLSKVWIKIRLK